MMVQAPYWASEPSQLLQKKLGLRLLTSNVPCRSSSFRVSITSKNLTSGPFAQTSTLVHSNFLWRLTQILDGFSAKLTTFSHRWGLFENTAVRTSSHLLRDVSKFPLHDLFCPVPRLASDNFMFRLTWQPCRSLPHFSWSLGVPGPKAFCAAVGKFSTSTHLFLGFCRSTSILDQDGAGAVQQSDSTLARKQLTSYNNMTFWGKQELATLVHPLDHLNFLFLKFPIAFDFFYDPNKLFLFLIIAALSHHQNGILIIGGMNVEFSGHL